MYLSRAAEAEVEVRAGAVRTGLMRGLVDHVGFASSFANASIPCIIGSRLFIRLKEAADEDAQINPLNTVIARSEQIRFANVETSGSLSSIAHIRDTV